MQASQAVLLIAFIVVSCATTIFAPSCVGRCNQFISDAYCQCNAACESYNDCCPDYWTICRSASCVGRCNQFISNAYCQCNAACESYNDCCPDYWTICRSDPTTRPATSTNAVTITGTAYLDVTEIAQTLWRNDVNRVGPSDITVELQGQVAYEGNQDRAPRRLFTYVNPSIFTRPTYAKFKRLLNNYNWDTRHTDRPSRAELSEIDEFLDTLLSTRVMIEAEQFLRNHSVIRGGSSTFRETLRALWFMPYSRSSRGPISSSGFEHIFVGELNRGTIAGLHSWIQIYLLEEAGVLDYQGYVSRTQPDVLAAQFLWHSYRKRKASFFLHASPEFEMALHTICLLTNPGPRVCQVNLDGRRLGIRTWDIQHAPGLQIGSAYPRV